jgi:hypothetical protein
MIALVLFVVFTTSNKKEYFDQGTTQSYPVTEFRNGILVTSSSDGGSSQGGPRWSQGGSSLSQGTTHSNPVTEIKNGIRVTSSSDGGGSQGGPRWSQQKPRLGQRGSIHNGTIRPITSPIWWYSLNTTTT